jgi:capsular polysaccharide export protein
MPDIGEAELDGLIDRAAALRVGGEYWGAQPDLPDCPYSLIRIREPQPRAAARAQVSGDRPILVADAAAPADPWQLVSGAAEAIIDADDELALVAALARVPVRCVGEGRFARLDGGNRAALRESFRLHVVKPYVNPFTGAAMTCAEALELAAFWRALIDSNRDIAAAVGFAVWKRQTVAPLLWGGSPVRFGKADRPNRSGQIAVWTSRIEAAKLAALQRSGVQLVEVEDGFVRSVGLGADCVPPLSIVVDRIGIYFDPGQPSALERLLQAGDFPPDLLVRARQLRELVVELGISKYAVGHAPLQAPPSAEKLLLVVGQVEDDRAVIAGLGPRTNLDLLQRVRKSNPRAHLIYKPHPDVEAGHRRGAVADELCLALADEIVREAPISSLIDLVDEVHVNTSLAGFEALLRGRKVITYGVPFYAGWGLTRDLGPVPTRRSSRRTVDELVAAALLLYPRYLDPVTRLPCPPEILIRRLAEGRSSTSAPPLVRLRRLQGRLKRKVASFQRAP